MANLKAGTTVGGDAVFTVGNISSYGLNFLNGDVGIGTASPTTKLHVYGGARIERNGDSPLLQFTDQGSSNRWIGIPDGTQRFSIYANDGTTEHLAIDSTGHVGIGTESPSFLLDLVQKDGGVQLQMGRSNTAAGTTWMGADSSGFHLGVGAYGAGNSVEDPNGFTVGTNGNVGIGTTSADAKLNVAYSSGDINDVVFQDTIRVRGDWTTAGSGPAITFTNYHSSANDLNPDTDDYNLAAIQACDIHGKWSGSLKFFVTPRSDEGGEAGGTSLAQAMIIDSGGNVGIGTTDPGDYRLNVNGPTNVQGSLYTDSLSIKNSAYEMWHRNYTVRSGNPQTILNESGATIAQGGSYRVTAHIPGTGTHTGASAVFWNSDGTWYVNQTVQPVHSSNHIGFYVTSDNKPTIQTWHTSDYSISVLHERMFLGEAETENTRYLFGMDGLLAYQNDGRLYLNRYDTANGAGNGFKLLTQTSQYSGWDIYKVSSNGFMMAHASTVDTNFWLGANTTYDSTGWKSLKAGQSSWGKFGGDSSTEVFAIFTDTTTADGGAITTTGNEMFKVTNTTTYDHGNVNVNASNIASYLPTHSHSASDITSGTLSADRIPSTLQNKYPCLLNSIGAYLPMVPGGLYATSDTSKTGAIKIKIPTKESRGMQSFFVDIYEYSEGESMTFKIGLYNSSSIVRTTVVNLSDNPNRDFNVRFYTDTNEQYLTIGETDSVWSYPQIAIRDFVSGYQTSQAEALAEWSISFVTSTPGTLNATHSNNYPSIDYDQIDNAPSYYTESEINHQLARAHGWGSAYGTNVEGATFWDQTEDAVRIWSGSDSSTGAAYKAIRVLKGDIVRFTVMAKGNVASGSGLYLRIYGAESLSDGNTFITGVSAETDGQVVSTSTTTNLYNRHNWLENQPIPSSWKDYTYEYTAHANGYISLTILNWSGHGFNSLYVKDPDIQVIGNVSNIGYLTDVYFNNAYTENYETDDFITELTEMGCFQGSNALTLKASWSYDGNHNLYIDANNTIELAGCLIETWSHGSYKFIRVTRPNTGTGGNSVWIYNDQGSNYAPGWRQMSTLQASFNSTTGELTLTQ